MRLIPTSFRLFVLLGSLLWALGSMHAQLNGSTEQPAAVSVAASSGTLNAPNFKGPGTVTEITATSEASFDQETRKAVFSGNVKIQHPEFTLTTDKLTAVLKKETMGGSSPTTSGTSPALLPALPGGGGLEKVIAEGNVVIVREKAEGTGSEAVRYMAKAARAEYDSATGDVTLTGWPQVLQGINMQVATSASTVMILNRNGRMRSEGGTKTVIQEGAPKPPAKTP